MTSSYEEIHTKLLEACKAGAGKDVDGPWIGLREELLRPWIEAESRSVAFDRGIALGYFSQLTTFRNHLLRKSILDWQIEHLRSSGCDLDAYAQLVEESPLLDPCQEPEYEGRSLGIELLRLLSYVHEMESDGLLDGVDLVVEVGSGYGGLARVLKSVVPSSTYVLVDIEESLLYSAHFISQHFPASVVCLIDEDSIAKVNRPWLSQFDFVFVPSRFVESLRDVAPPTDNPDCPKSLFVNIFSFGEMHNSAVARYLAIAQNHSQFSGIFLLNLVFQKARRGHPADLSQGEWITMLSKHWDLIQVAVNPPLVNYPAVTSLPSALLLTAKHQEQPRTAEYLDRMLEEVLVSDWVHFSRVGHGEGCRGTALKASSGALEPPAAFYRFIADANYRPSPAECWCLDFDFFSYTYRSGTLRLRTFMPSTDATLRQLVELNLYSPSPLTVRLMRLYLRVCVVGWPVDHKHILKEEVFYGRLLEGSFKPDPLIASDFNYAAYADFPHRRRASAATMRFRFRLAKRHLLARARGLKRALRETSQRAPRKGPKLPVE